jgi:hypothetical protein
MTERSTTLAAGAVAELAELDARATREVFATSAQRRWRVEMHRSFDRQATPVT